MRIALCFLSFFLIVTPKIYAETIYLNNGEVIKGPIAERASNYIIIKKGKRPVKYYYDEIKLIVEKGQPEPLAIDYSQFENISEQKVNMIIHLLQVNGARNGLESNFERLISKASKDGKEELRELFNIDELIGRLIPIYDKHYTQEELQKIIQFYESPAGQKVITATPEILNEALSVSALFFQEKLRSKQLEE